MGGFVGVGLACWVGIGAVDRRPSEGEGSPAARVDQRAADQLVGVWGAELDLSTRIRGRLRIAPVDGALVASIAGVRADTQLDGSSVLVELPHGQGEFRGSMSADGRTIAGHWIQALGRIEVYEFATPLVLTRSAAGVWEGEARPFDERFSLYLVFSKEDDGTIGAVIRNPERNVGMFIRANTVEVEGAAVRLLNADGDPVLAGTLDDEVLSISVPGAGTFDFRRTQRHEAIGLYPRPEPVTYRYTVPTPDEDGWTTAHAEDVGMSPRRLSAFVQQLLDIETDSHRTPHIQGLLVARHGKLILEEYFYGFHADLPHDLRSASKSITGMMVGQAVREGAFTTDTPVYPLFPESVANPDPRKADLTVEHLLTMNSGYACDDNDFETPGNEDRMQSQSEQPDWRRYTLDLPMARAPGERGVYCTGGINLLGAIIEETTGEPLTEFFRTRFAGPLGIDHYHMNLDPLSRGYAGGGLRLRPRDFLKFAQTMADGGRWNGQQVLDEEWVQRSLVARSSVNVDDDYGYTWWRTVHEHDERTFESWSATGNGGQLLIIVPEHDLAVAINGGNYADFRTWIAWRDQLMPEFIVDAIMD